MPPPTFVILAESAVRQFTLMCLAALTLYTGSVNGGTSTIEGRVVGVHDGDTITLLDAEHRQHKLRLDGIDAPELGQPFGRAAKQHLADHVADCNVVAECHKTDRYGRNVCRVLGGGVDVGLEQLRAGMAWYFRRYASELPRDRHRQYVDAEGQAKGERRGLWSDAGPVPPSGWRQDQKQVAPP